MIHHGVTGGQVGAEKSRLDFDSGDHTYDKEELTNQLNILVEADHPVGDRWIEEAELDANLRWCARFPYSLHAVSAVSG